MGVALRRIKVYAKLAAIVAVLFVVFLVVLLNRNKTASVWFFGTFEDINVLWLILVTACGSVIGFWIVSKVWRTYRELRQLQRDEQAQASQARQREMLERVDRKEREMDRKLREAIEKEEDD